MALDAAMSPFRCETAAWSFRYRRCAEARPRRIHRPARVGVLRASVDEAARNGDEHQHRERRSARRCRPDLKKSCRRRRLRAPPETRVRRTGCSLGNDTCRPRTLPVCACSETGEYRDRSRRRPTVRAACRRADQRLCPGRAEVKAALTGLPSRRWFVPAAAHRSRGLVCRAGRRTFVPTTPCSTVAPARRRCRRRHEFPEPVTLSGAVSRFCAARWCTKAASARGHWPPTGLARRRAVLDRASEFSVVRRGQRAADALAAPN